MPVQAIIADLDNTLYPVSSIGDQLFAELFELLAQELDPAILDLAKADIKRKPFQWVAEKYGFESRLTARANALLNALEWKGEMQVFPDYPALRDYPADRYLVTTGYTRLQESKVRQLGIAGDFISIHIVDPGQTADTKKTIFAAILKEHGYRPERVLVVGDDPDSELLAGRELGLVTVLYDPGGKHKAGTADYSIRSFHELAQLPLPG